MESDSAVKPDVTGDLERYPLPRLLFYLYKRAFLGRLEVGLPNDVMVQVYLREGIPAHVKANLPEDYLGRVLLEQGWLDSEQYNQSLVLLAQGGKRHGEILRELGFIDDQVLVAGLQLQLRRKLNRLFFAEDAPFSLYGGEHSMGQDAETQQVRADPLWVIHQGVRNAYGPARLNAELAKLRSAAVHLRQDIGQVLPRFGLDEHQMSLAQVLMRGVVPFDKVAGMGHLAPVETDMLLYLFWVTEVLTVVAASAVPSGGPAPRTGTGFAAVGEPVPVPGRASSPGTLSSSGEFAVESSLKIAEDIADALGGATGDEFSDEETQPKMPNAATVGRASSPGRHSQTAATSTAPPAAQRAPLAGFQATISASTGQPKRPDAAEAGSAAPVSKPARTASRSSTAKGGRGSQPRISREEAEALRREIRKQHAQLDECSHYEALGVTRGCSVGEARDAYFALAKRFHPDRVAGAGLDDMASEAEEVFRRVNEAHAVLTDLQLRREYDKVLDGGGSDEADEARALIEAEMAFQRGTVAFRKRDYAGALAQFEEACRLNDREGEHLAWRAWTRFCDPKLDNSEALPGLRGELRAAIKCSPKSAVSHYFLGEVHLAMGDDKKAIASFEKTIELKPSHVDALRQLRLIRMRQERGKQSGGMSGLLNKFRKK